ncbi:peroxisomal serine-active lipase [Fusarium albosuccineum]|uniref:Peroxisomal serine-active lipase n=1 Tax=Fusarium albosuccineum TaxID=1237068 RepID=A0A8H4L2J8_9HYPO|nr:peroxisomal serine-active lipase [Fusarium albosuccineum]
MAAPDSAAVQQAMDSTDPHLTDPSLLKDNSEFKTYNTGRFEYSGVRVFHRQHAKADQLPRNPAPLPLLVFLHGLGGSVAQFHPLLSSLVDLAPCLAIDYPGCGRSDFSVTSWEAYTTQALVELLEIIIEDYRDKDAGQRVVLIGHSMGTALSAQLANTKLAHVTSLAEYVVGLMAICPVSSPPNESTTTWARRAMWIPGWLFDLWRAWDGWGGPESPSVKRFVGQGADEATRILQYRFNKQSRTPVWRRMANGALPIYKDGKPTGGIPGLDIWAGLGVPVYLIAGENDNIVSPKEVEKITKVLDPEQAPSESEDGKETHDAIVDAAGPVSTSVRPQDHIPQAIDDLRDEDFQKIKPLRPESSDEDSPNDPSTPNETMAELPAQPNHPKKVVRSIVMPPPATHAVLYTPCSVRAVAGLISDFLATHITGRLSLAWQLQYLSREGKWDVKNLAKWKSVNPVSEPIGPADNPVFRALKTLREADDVHCPPKFVANWGDVVKDVIDISKDQPVYDPRGLDRAGVHYHKFPTVSKIPPQAHEVEAFIKLVDELREKQAERAAAENWPSPEQCVVGVHCHYGFNRTGYFIVCYLVERCGYGVQEAIDTFARARPNGIRHSHFLDRLYVRYNVDAVPHNEA